MAMVMPPRSVPVQRPYPPGTPGAEGPTEPIFKVELPKVADDDKHFGGCRGVEHCYERQEQIGEGTYGEVYLAKDRASGDRVALKKIRMDNEKEGFPITAIREIKLLKQLNHENVIRLREIVRSQTHKVNNFRGSIYMVFDYMDHDLTGLMERKGYKFTVPQVKCYMKQLFNGLHHCHQANILHRDLKASNLLIDNTGTLKLADFGLARRYNSKENAKLTNRVITLWYRPPELILGKDRYGPEIDMWSVGCICAELLTGKPMFPGKDEADQLEKIFSVLGFPNEQTMPGCTKLPNYANIRPTKQKQFGLEHHFKKMGQQQSPEAIVFLERLLNLNPQKRMSAHDGYADKSWMWSHPCACEPHELPTLPASHEMQMKRKRHAEREAKAQGPPNQQQDPNKRARHAGPQGPQPGIQGHLQQQRRGPGAPFPHQASQYNQQRPVPGALPRPAPGYSRPQAIPRPAMVGALGPHGMPAGAMPMGPPGYMPAPGPMPGANYPVAGGYGANRYGAPGAAGGFPGGAPFQGADPYRGGGYQPAVGGVGAYAPQPRNGNRPTSTRAPFDRNPRNPPPRR